jgi:hypothetical protein
MLAFAAAAAVVGGTEVVPMIPLAIERMRPANELSPFTSKLEYEPASEPPPWLPRRVFGAAPAPAAVEPDTEPGPFAGAPPCGGAAPAEAAFGDAS